jgi:hypothetical protein
MYEQMTDVLSCPVCLEMLIDPVDCQECSGTICRKCLPANDADNCVLCRQVSIFRPSRNTVKFLDLLKFKCRFRDLGCMVESVYSNWDQHNKNCNQKTEIEQLKAEYVLNMTQSNNEIANLKAEIKSLKSAQKEKITNIHNEHKKHSDNMQNKINSSLNKIQQLEKIIEEKNKTKEISIEHESGIFKLIDNKNGSF